MIDEVTDILLLKYPEMFKPSQRCRPPHLNVDVFRDDIYQSSMIPKLSLKNAAELEKHLMLLNNKFANLTGEQWDDLAVRESGGKGEKSKTFDTALKKAKEYNFFLGMSKSWLGTLA